MRIWLRGVAVAAVMICGVAGAQTLEQSYAAMCSGKKKASETCRTLRAGLMNKLANEDSAAPTADAPPPESRPAPARARQAAVTKKGVVSPKWGLWARLAGVTTRDEEGGAVRSYSWLEKGQVLEVERLAREDRGTSTFTLLDGGDVEVRASDGTSSAMSPDGKGNFVAASANGRWRYSFLGKKMIITEEKQDGAGWVPTGKVQVRRVLAPGEIAKAKAAINAERMAFAAEVEKQWGVIGKIVGRSYLLKNPSAADDAYGTWQWIEPGKSAQIQWFKVATRAPFAWEKLVRDSVSGTITGSNNLGKTAKVAVDGAMVKWHFATPDKPKEELHRDDLVSDEGYASESYTLKKGKKRDAATHRYQDVTALRFADIASDTSQRMAAAAQKQAAAKLAAAQAPKKKSGGWMGALGGAMLGAMAGGDTSQIIGAAAKGAAMLDPGGAGSGALNTIGDTMISGGNSGGMGTTLGNAVTGASSGGNASASANGHPYGNLAEGSCSMMNLSNYRTVALSGGNDVQLKTLCGQAFEYYSMYKRAITQGYGHDDLMRTYNAHKDAAAVVNQFYAEAR